MIERTSLVLGEMNAFLELGMQRECLGLARQVLRHRTLTTQALLDALDAVLIQADDLRRWRRAVEAAHERFSARQRRVVRNKMFHFYVSLNDLGVAFRFMPLRPRTGMDLVFSMWTLLHLKYGEACDGLYRRVVRLWRKTECDLEQSCCLEAMAVYYAKRGWLQLAETMWSEGLAFRWFEENAWEGMIKIQVARAIDYAGSAQKRISSRACDWSLILPRNEESRKLTAGKKMASMKQSLHRVLPETELWRFGGTGIG